MTMVKTEYEMVGRAVSRIHDKENRLVVAAHLSAEFTVRDQKFDRSRFMVCANVWPCEFCDHIGKDKQDMAEHYNKEHYEREARA